MQIGFIGLGKMGGGMSARLASAGHEVHGYAPSVQTREAAEATGVHTHISRDEMIQSMQTPRAVWVMIPDRFVEEEISQLIEILEEGDIIIEGGNTPFKQAVDQSARAHEKGIQFLDIGVSGGLVGADQGYSMMAGGDQEAYETIEPLLRDLCQQDGYGYFGPAGAGHFVKMVHNGIEYGVMQAFAEGFEIINSGPYENIDLSKLADVWQHGSIIQSFINSLAVDIFRDNRSLDGVEGSVNMLGEGQWTLEYAQEHNIDARVLEAAIARRAESQAGNISFASKYLAATRNAFGGHSLNKINDDSRESTRNV